MDFDQGSALLHFTRNGAFGPGATELLVLERGEGPYVFDTHGRRYVDGLSSLFCAQIGYSYGEEMATVAGEQLSKLAFNTLWGTAHPAALQLADRLADLAPAGIDRVFFTSGGSESVEAAWKIVRQYHLANGQPQAAEGDRAQHRLPRRHPRRPGAHRRARLQGAVRAARDRHHPRLQHQPLPQPAPGRGAHHVPAGGDGAGDHRRGSRDRRDDHRRAGPERRRLPRPAARVLGGPAPTWPTATGSCWSPTR